MLKKILTGTGIAAVLTIGVIIGSITLGPAFAQKSDENNVTHSEATISAAEAEAIAIAANPGTNVVQNELEKENGILIYSIELSNGTDVEVDASTGTILQTEFDNKDDGDVEDNDDGDVDEIDDGDVEDKDDGAAEDIDDDDVEEQDEDNDDEDMTEDEETAAPNGEAIISADQAEAIALAEYPDTTVKDTELEKEHGVLIYSIELSNHIEVEIDASTGEILSIESDDD